MKNPRRIYVRSRMDSWDAIKVPIGGIEAPLNAQSIGSCGLMICYPTEKAFLKAHPGERPLIFHLNPQEKGN